MSSPEQAIERLEREVKDLEERIEGMEGLLADLLKEPQRAARTNPNGRGLSPFSANQLRNLPGQKN